MPRTLGVTPRNPPADQAYPWTGVGWGVQSDLLKVNIFEQAARLQLLEALGRVKEQAIITSEILC